ncbi:leucine-rich_repeat domain-containing protein [Hexamita inflata]|uniref:Leucine-rich repeat domain-containing protein n=1 Tax=Hexamita inflata TaxID=28002 RepID=A0AA86QBQ1_9EUKA|nr:leucine-rich repeat domain-containing protein [Hexamita inflata]
MQIQEDTIYVQIQEQDTEYDTLMAQKYMKPVKFLTFTSFVEDQKITTLKFVEKQNLQDLQVYSCQNLNFSRVPMCLKTLNIISCNIKNLDGLRQMQQLDKLRIFSNRTPLQLTELQYLTNLKCLDLESCLISDITPLRHILHLQTIILSRNNIDDLKPLKNHTELVTLNLFENEVIDLSPLQNLTNLKSLELSGNPIVHIKPITNLKQLSTLNLNQTFVLNSFIQNYFMCCSFEIRNRRIPSQKQIQVSMNFQFINFNQQMLKQFGKRTLLFNTSIKEFNRKMIEASTHKLRYSERLCALYKQLEIDASFYQ